MCVCVCACVCMCVCVCLCLRVCLSTTNNYSCKIKQLLPVQQLIQLVSFVIYDAYTTDGCDLSNKVHHQNTKVTYIVTFHFTIGGILLLYITKVWIASVGILLTKCLKSSGSSFAKRLLPHPKIM